MSDRAQIQQTTIQPKSDAHLALQKRADCMPIRVTLSGGGDLIHTAPQLVDNNLTPSSSLKYNSHYTNKPVQFTMDRENSSSRIQPEARTSLGKRLLILRGEIIKSGVKLLDWNEVINETRERRGD